MVVNVNNKWYAQESMSSHDATMKWSNPSRVTVHFTWSCRLYRLPRIITGTCSWRRCWTLNLFDIWRHIMSVLEVFLEYTVKSFESSWIMRQFDLYPISSHMLVHPQTKMSSTAQWPDREIIFTTDFVNNKLFLTKLNSIQSDTFY